jgi:4'-phosphopantetheinyl transferase
VHVWLGQLEPPPEVLRRCAALLSADEQQRAARFYFPRDANRFTVARGTLRTLLGHYLGEAPHSLRFVEGTHGKPALAGSDVSLHFNISHSHQLALVAVAREREVGVDIERLRPEVAGEKIAERFFSTAEVATLRALPTEQQVEGFFNCWARKEAYIKGRGLGLALQLDAFDVSLVPGQPAALLATRGPAQDGRQWQLYDLPAVPGYAAALAVEGAPVLVQNWHWNWFEIGEDRA